MALYDFQQDAVHQIRAAALRSKSVVYVVSTGAGKTVVASEIARLASQRGSRTLFLVHRRELVRQALKTIQEACPGLSIGVEARGWPNKDPWAMMQVGMVQTLARRPRGGFKPPTIVIIDEAHHARAGTWEKVLSWWPDAYRIGLTATPQRLDGKGLGSHFVEMVKGPSMKELIAGKYLSPTRTLRIPSGLVMEGVRKTSKGEYRADDISERLTPGVIASAADAYIRYAAGKKAIFFGIHTDHSKRVVAGLRARGVRAEHVDANDTPTRRDRVMTEFRTGGIDVIGNCSLIDEGFDAPACEVVMDGAPTMSVTRYLQRVGRPMRYLLDKIALHVDLVGNSYEHGLPDEDRDWSLDDGELRTDKGRNGKLRVCEECQTMFYGAKCPHCQIATPLPEVEEVETELVEAVEGPRIQRRRGRSELWRILGSIKRRSDRRLQLERIAYERGYKPGWVIHILRAWGEEV